MKTIKLMIVSLLAAVSAGCFTGMTGARGDVSSSLVDYLYPKGETPPPVDSAVPNLKLPLRVGLAFVPGSHYQDLSEVTKQQLLDKVKQAFQKESFISEIVIIPDTYLRGGRGFDTLTQVSRMYGTEVMALVSYDQVNRAVDNKASFLYWTIVGAYVIPGSDTSVQTFVDTAVFDVATRKLLFRAPGINKLEDSSTLVDAERTQLRNSEESFALAVDDMNKNLATELSRFKERVKTEQVATVSYRSGGGGGGAVLLLPLGLIVLVRRFRRA